MEDLFCKQDVVTFLTPEKLLSAEFYITNSGFYNNQLIKGGRPSYYIQFGLYEAPKFKNVIDSCLYYKVELSIKNTKNQFLVSLSIKDTDEWDAMYDKTYTRPFDTIEEANSIFYQIIETPFCFIDIDDLIVQFELD